MTGTYLVHIQVPTKVDSHYLPIAITVLESDNMEFLFGLDMLKRYQCSIDLKSNVLRFGSLEPAAALPFLAEHELPKSAIFAPEGAHVQQHGNHTAFGMKTWAVALAAFGWYRRA